MTVCSAPCSRSTPWISSRCGAVRSICAPMAMQQRDEVVRLRLLRRVLDDRGPVGQDGGQQGVLGAHDGYVRERDPRPAQAVRRLGEVVAVLVLDLRAELAHGLHVQVDRAVARSDRHPGSR